MGWMEPMVPSRSYAMMQREHSWPALGLGIGLEAAGALLACVRARA